MKVVFDTNLLISGFFTTAGISQYVFSLGIKRHTVILSQYILDELERKLVGKFEIPARQVESLIQFLRSRAIIFDPPANPRIQFADKKDIPLLNLAEASDAHYLVTGDKGLLKLKKIGKTLILSPREAIEIL